jgi:hypothetical protein
MGWIRTPSEITPEEDKFLLKQMEGYLMEAHVALVRAAECAVKNSPTDLDIGHAVVKIDEAIERKHR